MERMIEYYTASDAYAEFLQRCDRAEYKPYVDMFRHFVKPAEGQVLDVGCGVGTSTVMLRHRGFEAIGADVSPRFLPANLPGFIVADFSNAHQVADNTYTAAGCHDVIEHIEEPLKFLAEMVRVVKPGGLVLVHAPNLTSPVVAARVVVDNLLGRTPYLGINNLIESVRLFLSSFWHCWQAKSGLDAFRMRKPRLETGIVCYDADAVYWTNPAEIRRFLESQGCEICHYQRMGRSWGARLIANFAPNFAGQICIVARKGNA